MNRLIKNELVKIFAQKKMYVFMVIIFAWTVFTTLISYIGIVNSGVNGQSLAFDNLSLMVDFLYPIFAIIIISELITEELSTGTFMLTLVHPVTRKKYLTAKILSVGLLILILMLFSIIISYITGMIAFGWGDGFKAFGQTLTLTEGVIWTISSHLVALAALMAFNVFVILLALELESSGAVVGTSIGIFFLMSVIRLFVVQSRPIIILTYFRFHEIILGSRLGLLDSNKYIYTGVLIILVYGFLGYRLNLRIITKKDFT